MPRPRLVSRLALVVMALPLAACGGSQDAAAEGAARDFYRAFAERDGAAACALLSARARAEVEQSTEALCEQGLLDEDLPQVGEPEAVRVYGVMAQVRFRSRDGASEMTFLSRFGERWRVTAAGCVATSDATPYDCQVSGG